MKFHIPIQFGLGLALVFFHAAHAQAPTMNFTAKSANVVESGTPIKINLLRWSTDQERKTIVDAMDPNAKPTAPAPGGGARGGGGRAGRGAQLDPDDPALAGVEGTRGGRGRGEAAKPPDPIATLTGQLSKATTVGYLWTNEVVGYPIKLAYRTPLPDGGERIILATDRRLGAGTAGWKVKSTGNPTDYEFTLIEIRMNAKGLGEGKTSLNAKVILDKEANTIAVENYAATPAILQNVAR